ncbi:hypothetical protein KHQ06_24635 [Nocardia tengchongensis]|uniref:Uncharacterized protein n=1 Tax=Nocardia tengchongensis TaxID=2055889 RepID=A0ABX8CHV2_9NOCA|nr:hypothetical protein [Nocardia tengchongensis]QVI19548.1 hypothetical protein KHQ06_24635 [Nocardia tengchongensis]
MAAPEHAAFGFDSHTTPVPALLCVADDGAYLMSNGLPRLLADPASPEGSSRIVRAHRNDIGSLLDDVSICDGFVEHIALTAQFSRQARTIDLIRRYSQRAAWLVLTITPSRFEISFTPSNSFSPNSPQPADQ